jgi:lantibiotic modifying enzyme
MCDPRAVPRRDFVRGGLGAAAALAGFPAFRLPHLSELLQSTDRPYVSAAVQAARWLAGARVRTQGGITWPADPNDTESVGTTLYTHSPGVVTFLLELFHSTGDEEFLGDACAGADHLAAGLGAEGPVSTGLYTGLGGIGFVLEETFRASGRPEYRDHAERCFSLIRRNAKSVGSGMAWPVDMGNGETREVTDIVSGTAGAGLTLLYADRVMGDDRGVELAMQAGGRLVELGIAKDSGMMWEMWPSYPREMPNFSHGTAGICYFLAALYRRTGAPEFLAAAADGARYLQSIATVRGDGRLIYHHAPDGEDLYYLSWCHGPVGTSRLFYELARATGDESWMEWVHMGAKGIMDTGIPETRTPGFWNNISQCCGTAAPPAPVSTISRFNAPRVVWNMGPSPSVSHKTCSTAPRRRETD